MERLSVHSDAPSGIGANMLRTWGLIFLAAGLVGRGLIQTHLLGVGTISAQDLMAAMNASQTTMILVTVSLVLQAVETCAAPIFAVLLITGVQKTADLGKYILRVTAAALAAELPYSLAVEGSLLAPGLNPMFSLVLGLALLYFYRRFPGRGFKMVAIKVLLTLAGVLWGQMLRIQCGSEMVIILAALWMLRDKPLYRNFAGMAAAVLCTAFTPFFLAAPMGFLAVHFYNGEKSDTSPWLNYLSYPALCVLTAGVSFLL